MQGTTRLVIVWCVSLAVLAWAIAAIACEKRIFLVSCVSVQQSRAMPARELYHSAWFKKARAFVERQGADWFILSSKHGLVAPDEVIEPYDVSLNDETVRERRQWSKKVAEQLRPQCVRGTCIIFLAGEKYRQFLVPALEKMSCKVCVPMKALRIGEQLHWLSEQGRSSTALCSVE